MNIALVTETFPPEINGVAMTFGIIARELGRRSHSVTVYRPHRLDLPHGPATREFHEVMLPGFPLPGYPQLRLGLPASRALRRRWRTDRPDLVHVATEGPLGASAIGAARSLGLPVTSSFHTNFHAYARHYGFGLFRRLALAWLRRVHNRTRVTFAPTSELCAELSGLGFLRLALLSRGVDARHFHPGRRSPGLRAAWAVETGGPVVMHVGRMAPEKNYALLFRVYAAMQEANPRCRFVLVGDGPWRDRLRRDFPDGLFTGFVPKDELARHYASADIYVHASLTETFGNVLMEAMASGLSVAAFDYAAARQFLAHEKNGLSVPCGKPEALIAAGVRLATDSNLRNRLRTAAAAAMQTLTWEAVVAKFETDLMWIASEHARVAAKGATS